MTLLGSYARLLNGTVIGQQIVFPAPGHSKRDRSASLKFSPNAPGGFIVHSFAGDDPLPIRDYVRERLGRALFQGTPSGLHANTPAPAKDLRSRALAVWKESRDPRGTRVEAYFRRRKIKLFNQASGETVRYHPACPFAGKYVPAMVCLVRDIVTNEPKAIHRTALTLQGDKAQVKGQSRLSLGPVAGGAIKFTPDEEVTTCLGIGEGLESALSLRHTPEFGPSPVWALISAGGIEYFPILAGIECLWIAVDHDETGVRVARSTGRRWQASGAEVFLTTPLSAGADLNDVLMAGGI
ncbi:toprim domain-containing protein [Microvirga sp. CF3062]|uniref:DUF7146 domain-containing protein n=1 Tax=Microvirga sp. CF3062 TaxID=3110182 RepID=UPI002E771F00|nr:toprim domain-containing protein [Microvirga sp. CF3062]MEE1658311.1 toprim domain-containing protein [Microvirga sp. CF3062]